MTSSFNIHVDNNLTFSNDADATLSVAAVSGTDTVGKNITITGGQGTGTGAGGSLIFQTADGAGSTGSSANDLVTKMTILDNGYVGIGATAPAAPLQVHGGVDDANLLILTKSNTGAAATDGFRIGWDGEPGNVYLFNNENSDMRFGTSNDEKMRITAAGNVGIGTDSPAAKLDIKGGGHSDYVLACQTSDNNGHTGDTGGFFGLLWDGSGVNYNMYVVMKNNTSPYNYQTLGRFENDTVGTDAFFTGQHRNLMNIAINETHVGLIACSSGIIVNSDNSLFPTINESLPTCVLATADNEQSVFGVISDKEDSNDTRTSPTGSYKSISRKQNKNEQRLFMNSVGEGSIWISNKNGTLENGDYIASTTVTGYGGKQSDGLLHNYTVAKITIDCDFSLTKIVKQKLKVNTITETKTRNVYEAVEKTETKTEIVYDNVLQKYVQKTTTETTTANEQMFDTVDLYNEAVVVIGTHQVQRTESYTETYTDIDYDANGDVQYEDDLDTSGNQQMVYPLETRFLQSDGTLLTDETDYTTRLANGESVYIACFVGCTYHCG
jgi:hypothetical protein